MSDYSRKNGCGCLIPLLILGGGVYWGYQHFGEDTQHAPSTEQKDVETFLTSPAEPAAEPSVEPAEQPEPAPPPPTQPNESEVQNTTEAPPAPEAQQSTDLPPQKRKDSDFQQAIEEMVDAMNNSGKFTQPDSDSQQPVEAVAEEEEDTVSPPRATVNLPSSMEGWVDYFRQTTPLNDLTYAHECYEPILTNLNTDQQSTLYEFLQAQQNYINRWIHREFVPLDYKVWGNRIEIRSRFRCVNTNGKESVGFCKTTWVISPRGRIRAYADSSSKTTVPPFSEEVLGQQTTTTHQPGVQSLNASSARYWADGIMQNYPYNSLSFTEQKYDSHITLIKTGQVLSKQELVKSQALYYQRWPYRECTPRDYAWRGNRVELRFQYSCTNTKGKTVRGFSKTTLIISPRGLIEGFADDSSTSSWPAFSPYVGSPNPL